MEISAIAALKEYDQREEEMTRILAQMQHSRNYKTVKRLFDREIAQMNARRPMLLRLAKLEAAEKNREKPRDEPEPQKAQKSPVSQSQTVNLTV